MEKPKIIEAGLAIRGEVRRWLMREGIDFKEDKGWIESTFYLKCSDEVYWKVRKILTEYYD